MVANPQSSSTHNRSRLFLASRVALIVTAMSFALRGEASGVWATHFQLTNEQVGWITGSHFWGFALAILIGGPLCDALGLRRIMGFAFVGHLAGILLTVFAWSFTSLLTATIIFGVANGSVEAACNPLVATLYPDDKTTALNQFHVWFPGGIVIGGLLAFALSHIGLGWQVQFVCLFVPLAIYGLLFWGQSFPYTERMQRGVSAGEMAAACLHPGFVLMVICMLLTAATELGPNQWIPTILSHAGVSGILVLVWITGLMAVGRQFAGAFVHSLSPLGMLFGSAILSGLGLIAMSHTSGAILFGAATIFAFGVCFFWPTMLGFVNETYPKTGALGLAIMGFAGVLSTSIILPVIGRFYDANIAALLPPGTTQAALSAAPAGSALATQWMAIQSAAGLGVLGRVAILPAVLVVLFLPLLVVRRRRVAAVSASASA